MDTFMSNARKQLDFINGVPEMLVLRLLARESMHGYQVVRAIAEATGRALAFGEGCIYPILHRLCAEGLVTSSRETVQGRSRVVYRTTPAGIARLAETTNHWQSVTAAILRVMEGVAREPKLA